MKRQWRKDGTSKVWPWRAAGEPRLDVKRAVKLALLSGVLK